MFRPGHSRRRGLSCTGQDSYSNSRDSGSGEDVANASCFSYSLRDLMLVRLLQPFGFAESFRNGIDRR